MQNIEKCLKKQKKTLIRKKIYKKKIKIPTNNLDEATERLSRDYSYSSSSLFPSFYHGNKFSCDNYEFLNDSSGPIL